MIKRGALFCLLFLPLHAAERASPSLPASTSKVTFTQPYTSAVAGGKQDYAYFHIPSVITTADGTLLAFAEGRVHSGADHGDIDLVLRRSTDQGLTWGPLPPGRLERWPPHLWQSHPRPGPQHRQALARHDA